MKCDRFEERVQQLLDRREDPRDDFELVDHAQECESCGGSFEASCALVDFFADCPAEETLPANFVDRVLAQLASGSVAEDWDRSDSPLVARDSSVSKETFVLQDGSLPLNCAVAKRSWLEQVPSATSVADYRGGAVAFAQTAIDSADAVGFGDIVSRGEESRGLSSQSWLALTMVIASMLLLVASIAVRPGLPSESVAQVSVEGRSESSASQSLVSDLPAAPQRRFVPVLASIADDSYEVVKPWTDGLTVAITVIRWHLLGGSDGLPADIRFDSVRDVWS